MQKELFSQPGYNTIHDTYQDPYKLGKYSYGINQNKEPIFIEPWKATKKSGDIFSKFKYVNPIDPVTKTKQTMNQQHGFEFDKENGTTSQNISKKKFCPMNNKENKVFGQFSYIPHDYDNMKKVRRVS